MKKILFLGLIFSSITATSQTISELQQQITILEQQKSILQEKIDFCDLYNNSDVSETTTFNSNFEFKVIECKGNSIDQTVELTITIKHSLPNQKIKIWTGSEKPVAYGETGKNYDFKSINFPDSRGGFGAEEFNSPTNLLLQGKLTFRNILPQTAKLSLVNGTVEFENKDGGGSKGKGKFEIRNLNINWN